MYIEGVGWPVSQQLYAIRLSKFVNILISCTCTFKFFFMSTKETYKISNCLKSEGDLSVQVEVASIKLDEMDAGHQIIHQCEDSYSWTT